MALFILTSTTLIFGVAFGYNYVYSRDLMLKNVRENATHLTQALVRRIEGKLISVEQMPRYLARHLDNRNVTRHSLGVMIENMVAANRDIYGSTVAFEPYALDPEARYFAPYVYRNETGGLVATHLGGDHYNYFLWDWYRLPRYLDRPVWSEPYFDEGGGNALMATYSHPFYDLSSGRPSFRGVVTADVSLEELKAAIGSVSLYQSGYTVLISRTGRFLAHRDPDRIMRDSIFSLAEALNLPALRRVGKDMIQGKEGFLRIDGLDGEGRVWLCFAPVPAIGWSVGVVIPEQALYADILALNHTVLLIGAAGFTLLLVVVVGISRSITRPLKSLVGATSEIAHGNLDISLPKIAVRDEVGQLSQSVDEMRLALKEYISHLTETTKARERIESELKIARSIQMNFLPKRFPPFPERREFDIFAVLEPAKQVGGDLYDFFFLDEDHLFFSIGDVSDKGVPAALFMAVTKTLMKGIAEQNRDPAEVLDRVNGELCHGNESSMFVTLFCAVLDLRSGRLCYSNAGHNPPLVLHRDGSQQWLALPPGLVLGGMEEAVYQSRELVMAPGDKLLLYTDGVTEAMNPEGAFYSEARLLAQAQEGVADSAESLVARVMASVRRFSAGAAQSDDITLLALSYKGTHASGGGGTSVI
jgi:sigma-B regulation protein RsbU (phosphoserine phosphatase)